jgi:hypothetical protein
MSEQQHVRDFAYTIEVDLDNVSGMHALVVSDASTEQFEKPGGSLANFVDSFLVVRGRFALYEGAYDVDHLVASALEDSE